jgi:hypothetical protein
MGLMSKQEITVTTNSLNKIPYQFDNTRIINKKCKLCNCDFRDEVEAWYDAQPRKNYTALQSRIKNEKNFDISTVAIKNHMVYHYKIAQSAESLGEYAVELQRWMGLQTNKVTSLKTKMAILEREMVIIASAGDELDIIERRKNAETVKKIADCLLAYETKMQDYEKQLEPITVIFNQLKIIINDEMANITSSQTKRVLGSVLQRLRDNIGDMMVDKD